MQSEIHKVYTFLLKLNSENGNELKITLDEYSGIIQIEHDVNEYCFFFQDKLVYVRSEDEIVCDSLEHFINYIVENKDAD